MINQELIFFNFDNISQLNGIYHIGNEFIMIDNLEDTADPRNIDNIFVKYPIRVVSNTIIFCKQGSLRVKANLNEYMMHKNDTLTLFPGSIMEYVDASVDLRIAIISFSNDYFFPIGHIEESMHNYHLITMNPKITLTDTLMGECLDVYLRMKKKLKQADDPFRKFSIKAYSYVLCALSYEYLASQSLEMKSNHSRHMSLYYRFIELLQRDFRQHRCVKYYAEKLNISPKYFSLLIKKASGKFAGEWIDEYVVLEAKGLLKSRRYTVQQVSDLLSFPNQSFFAKYFKAHTGYTPTQYQVTEN